MANQCRQCGQPCKHTYCNKRCKDRWHNIHNPRGKFAHLKGQPLPDHLTEWPEPEGWDGHKR